MSKRYIINCKLLTNLYKQKKAKRAEIYELKKESEMLPSRVIDYSNDLLLSCYHFPSLHCSIVVSDSFKYNLLSRAG